MTLKLNFIFKHRWLLLIALLSFLLKLKFVLQGSVVNSDAALYIAAAERFSHGLFSEGLQFYRMPFYPLLLAATHAIISDWIVAGWILTVVPLWLTLIPLYLLSRRLYSRHSALWTILLYSVIPIFNTSSTDIKRDPLFLFFTVSAVLFMVVFYQKHRFRDMLYFSLLVVLATLTRIEGVLIPIVFLMTSPFYVYRRGGLKVVYCIVIGFIALPLTFILILWLFETMGGSTSSRLHEVFTWGKNLINLKLFIGYQKLMVSLREFQDTLPRANLQNNLIEITRHYAPLIYVVGLVEMMVKGIFPTSLLGLYGLRWRNRENNTREFPLIFVMWFAFILLNLIFNLSHDFIAERYLWIPMVLTLPWVGEGLNLWWQRYEAKKLLAYSVLIIVIFSPLSKTFAVMARSGETAVIDAGQWLKQYDAQQQLSVIFNDRRLPLYSDRFSDVNKIYKLKAMLRYLKHNHKVSLVVLYLSNAKYPELSIDGFELVEIFNGEEKAVLIFRRL